MDYLNYLNENNDYLNIIKQGNIALEKMNKEYIVRSKIAISIANAMLKLDSKSNINKYLYEAFVSDTSIANLLKILLNKDCFNEYHHKIVTIIHENDAKIKNKNSKEAYLNYSYDDTDEDDEFEDNEIVEESDAIERNSLSIREYRVLLLLLGDVDNTIGYLKGINNYLGWSYSDINQLIYLLLLLLYNGTKYTNVRIGMASNIVYKDDFIENRYLYNISNDNSRMMALDIMNSWKANYQLDEAKEQEILDLLAEKVRKRVAAILEGKYRQSYWKAAMVIVALGEVYESLNIMSKDDYAEEYHQKYRRFNAFRKELRESTYRYNW